MLVVSLALAPSAAAQAPARDTVAESVRQAFADYERRINAGDFTGALQYYADDPRFFWVEQGKVVARSRAEIVKGYDKLKESAFHITYEAPLITVLAPDAAMITAGFSARMGSGAKAAQFSGLVTLVLVRTGAGWRFLSGRA